jgi:GTP-binding protein Era
MSEMMDNWPTGKVGVVAIVGRPNVGKSTFLNRVLDYRLTAVSSRPQTTRQRWRGILSDASSQIIFVDTPGVHAGKTRLGEAMLGAVSGALKDADVAVLICDPGREPGAEDALTAEQLADIQAPLLLVLNKSDTTDEKSREASRVFYLERLGDVAGVLEISALNGNNCEALLELIREQLPSGPFFYDPEQITDAFERDIAAEMIREAALQLLYREVPHALAVEIVKWKENGPKLRVDATIYVERDSQKPIIIGDGGEMLNQIRRDAVNTLRESRDQRIDLRLHVKVAPDWRNKSSFLKGLGLTE